MLFNTSWATIFEHFYTVNDIFKYIFLYEDMWISIDFSLKFVPKVQINNSPALGQRIVWHRPGDKPLSEPMMAYMRHSASCVLECIICV